MLYKTNLHYELIFSFLILYSFFSSSYADSNKKVEVNVKRIGITALQPCRFLGAASGIVSISSFYLAWQNYKNLCSKPLTEDTGELADAFNELQKSIGTKKVTRFISIGLIAAIPAVLLHKCPKL